MAHDMRDLVKEGYDHGEYEKKYRREGAGMDPFEEFMLDEFSRHLEANPEILDLGCGTGLPFDQHLIGKGVTMTGVDLSEKHVALAKENVPRGTFVQGDFFSHDEPGAYDGVMSLYAVFHIPREEHAELLNHIRRQLKDDGFILITLGTEPMEQDVNPDFAGAPMAWSSYTVEENKELVRKAGFDVLMAAEDYRTEKHLWVLARKK